MDSPYIYLPRPASLAGSFSPSVLAAGRAMNEPLDPGFLAWISRERHEPMTGYLELPLPAGGYLELPLPPSLQVDDEIEIPRPDDSRRR
ncbi:MAG: hypothetical protein ABI592_00525 [Acidobacteriota bacterium]